jgi:aryl-alcohol dehydrogenase-like predicted oxidoreductase
VRTKSPHSISVVGVSTAEQLEALLQAEELCVNEKEMEGIFAISPPFRYEAQFKV